jgi:NIPSNAP
MWESKFAGRTEFVCLLQWLDEPTMRKRWEQFLADEEWNAIKKDTGAKHGQLVGEIEDRVLTPTDYSPRRDLTR